MKFWHSFTLVMSLNQLEKTFLSLFKGKSVAIVGGSPDLIGKRLGSIIDDFDVVVRFNLMTPQGLEEDYGNRTDIRFIGCTLLDKHSEFFKKIGSDQYLISTGKNKEFLSGRKKKVFLYHKDLPGQTFRFITKSTGVIVSTSHRKNSPKSGLVLLSLLLRFGQLRTIGTFGFSLKSEDAWSVVDYQKRGVVEYDPEHILKNHCSPDLEIKTLSELIKRQYIKAY
jgi:hypothetical protein